MKKKRMNAEKERNRKRESLVLAIDKNISHDTTFIITLTYGIDGLQSPSHASTDCELKH